MTADTGPFLRASERHLFAPGRKRMLCLDGGGVRGALSLAILERLEAVIDEIEGAPTLLCDWFDLIGGTSTGSIIATALALGYRAAQVRDLYFALGPKIFRPRWLQLFGWKAKFDARVLERELALAIGGRTLESPDFRTGLCILMKRLDTGSSWIVMNNPRSAFWNDPADGSYLGNRSLPVAGLVRASTAAPSFFDPQPISIGPGRSPGMFIDGGLTPHNNPTLMMLMTALLPSFGLNWTAGPDDLLLVSVGTGSFRPTLSLAEAQSASGLGLAFKSLAAIIAENQQLVLTLLTYFGQATWHWPINSEIGNLSPLTPPGGHLFRFARYDARLEAEWLAGELGESVAPAELLKLRRMDDPANMRRLYEIGAKAAALEIRPEHLAGFERAGMPGAAGF